MELQCSNREARIILWHFLSAERLRQKASFAHRNSGRLLLETPELSKDISEGALGRYLYCLKSPLGGMVFSEDQTLRLIRIEVQNSARSLSFCGDPTALNFSEIKSQYDLVDLTVSARSASAIRFRQILHLNEQIVSGWTEDATAFLDQWPDLVTKRISREDFFMQDFTYEEQTA
jgi:hypothetical protein